MVAIDNQKEWDQRNAKAEKEIRSSKINGTLIFRGRFRSKTCKKLKEPAGKDPWVGSEVPQRCAKTAR